MIINCLTKGVYYKLVKVTISILDPAKVIINIVMHQHNICKTLIMN